MHVNSVVTRSAAKTYRKYNNTAESPQAAEELINTCSRQGSEEKTEVTDGDGATGGEAGPSQHLAETQLRLLRQAQTVL